MVGKKEGAGRKVKFYNEIRNRILVYHDDNPNCNSSREKMLEKFDEDISKILQVTFILGIVAGVWDEEVWEGTLKDIMEKRENYVAPVEEYEEDENGDIDMHMEDLPDIVDGLGE